MKFIVLYFFVINYLAFSMFALDKERAKQNKPRVSEKNLLTLCFFGGSIGAWIAMRKLRHKTSKDSFKVKFYSLFALQLLVLFFLFKR